MQTCHSRYSKFQLCPVKSYDPSFPVFSHFKWSYRLSQWPRGLRHGSAATRLLRLWARIPQGSWMFGCCECCELSGRGLRRADNSSRVVLQTVVRRWVWSRNLLNEEAVARGGGGCWAQKKVIPRKQSALGHEVYSLFWSTKHESKIWLPISETSCIYYFYLFACIFYDYIPGHLLIRTDCISLTVYSALQEMGFNTSCNLHLQCFVSGRKLSSAQS
jgi:hypothetical protein